MESMYETLLRLPLFQGVSRAKLSEVIEKTPFHFLKFDDGQPIAAAGDSCGHIRFVVSGSVRLTTASPHRRVTVSQTLASPAVIGPEYLFGLDTRYPFSVQARGQCGILQLTKADFINVVTSDRIFLLNTLNILSRGAQRCAANALSLSGGGAAEKIAHYIISLTYKGAVDITLTFRQKDLCQTLGTQRASLMAALDKLSGDGIVDCGPSSLTVRDRASLMAVLSGEP